jgi:tyrosine-protein kinase
MSGERELTIRDYGRVVRRRKWIVVVAVAAAVGGALVMSLLQDPIYEAEAQMLVEPRSGTAVFEEDPQLSVQNLERAIQTEIQVLEGQRVRERVRDELGLSELPPEADASAVGSTDVVSVTVRSEDPRTAQILADAYVRAYAATRREQAVDNLSLAETELRNTVDDLQAQIDAADPDSDQRDVLVAQQAAFKERLDQLQIDAAVTTGGTSVVKEADLPADPVEPRPLRTALLAGVVGLLVGLGAAFLVDHLDDSIRTADDLESVTDAPVLAVVPVEPPPDHRPIALSEPHEFAVEIYRGLRTNVLFLALDKPMRVIHVTSSIPGEGKTTVATNLAVVLAQAGSQVALVDADLRNPQVHEAFGTRIQPGLTELLLGEQLDMVFNHFEGGLHVVAAGAVPPNPSEMLSSDRIGGVLGEIASRYDFVIVDSAPILPVADSVALSRVVDGVLFVTQANRTSKRELRDALGRLERIGAPVFGVVLNRFRGGAREGGYGYGYSYGYGHPPDARGDGSTAVADAAPAGAGPATDGEVRWPAPVGERAVGSE